MSKRKKKKKKLYNKRQFENIFCNKCNLCNGSPTFCHTDIYCNHPHLFTNDIFGRLLEIKEWNKDRKHGLLGPEEFRYAFCMVLILSCNPFMDLDENVARTTLCNKLRSCYDKFVEQQAGKKSDEQSLIKTNRKKKRDKHKESSRYVCESYPTIIINDNQEWKNFIKGLFVNGNNVNEQNTTERIACQHQGTPN